MSHPRQADYPIDPLFLRRWSPRAFADATMTQDELLTLLEAARWAPSGNNSQPWRFIIARRGTPAWAPMLALLKDFNQLWAQHAAALVLVLSRTRQVPPGKTEPQALPSHSFDAGAAWASLAFQAVLSGWVTHAMGGFHADRARQVLGIPEDHTLEAFVAIGRPGDPQQLPPALRERELPNGRRPLADLVADGRFDFPV